MKSGIGDYWNLGLNEIIIVVPANGVKCRQLSDAYCLVNYLAPIMSK